MLSGWGRQCYLAEVVFFFILQEQFGRIEEFIVWKHVAQLCSLERGVGITHVERYLYSQCTHL